MQQLVPHLCSLVVDCYYIVAAVEPVAVVVVVDAAVVVVVEPVVGEAVVGIVVVVAAEAVAVGIAAVLVVQHLDGIVRSLVVDDIVHSFDLASDLAGIAAVVQAVVHFDRPDLDVPAVVDGSSDLDEHSAVVVVVVVDSPDLDEPVLAVDIRHLDTDIVAALADSDNILVAYLDVVAMLLVRSNVEFLPVDGVQIPNILRA